MVDFTDDFNRADGGLGANWTTSPSFAAPQIISNQVTGASSVNSAAFVSSETFEDDQRAQITLSDWVDDLEGPIVRHQAGSSSFYLARIEFLNQQFRVLRYDAGTPTDLGTTGGGSAPWADGDTAELAVVGSSLQCSRNGTPIGSTFIDGTYTDGAPGFLILDNQDRIDDFVAGPIAAAGAVPQAAHSYRMRRAR